MEDGVLRADISAFGECLSLSWKNPYVLRLAFSAGIGGLLFGYDTRSYISGLFCISEMSSKQLTEKLGSRGFGWRMDQRSIWKKERNCCSRCPLFIGSVIMAAASSPIVLIVGRVFVGIGVGMASMASPLYISRLHQPE
ncbi:hypothetical protein ACSQ67_026323 [Phaseolus vulgaris]